MFEWYVVVPSLEVYHADPFGTAKIRAIMPRIVQLIVVLVRSLVDGYNVLADPIGLSRLHPWYQQQRSYAPGLLIQQDRTNNPLTYQFVKVDVQPHLLLRAEAHRARLDADLIPQLQAVVISRILHLTDVGLLGCQTSLTG